MEKKEGLWEVEKVAERMCWFLLGVKAQVQYGQPPPPPPPRLLLSVIMQAFEVETFSVCETSHL